MIAASILAGFILGQAGQAPGAEQAPGAPVVTLEETLRLAEQNNLDLKAARARLQQARQGVGKAWSYYLPQVTAGGTFTHNNTPVILDFTELFNGAFQAIGQPTLPLRDGGPFFGPPAVIQKQNQLAAQAQVTQAIFAPGAWYAISSAYLGTDIAELTTENARRQVLFGAAQAYYGAASLKQAVSVQQRQLAVTRDHERDARVRYQAGTTAKVALLRAEIDRARAEQDLKRAQNAYASAKVGLATLIGRSDEFEVVVPPEQSVPQQGLAELTQAALRDRPDVKAAGDALRLAEKARNTLYTQYLPTLGAFGRLTWSNVGGFSGDETNWAIGLGLNWTIFDGGLREATIRENNAKVLEAEANRQNTNVKAIQDVRQATLDLDSAIANKSKAGEQLSLARENSKLVEVNYRAGAATYIEVADANSALLSAELGEVGETLNADLSALRLLQAAGAFNPK